MLKARPAPKHADLVCTRRGYEPLANQYARHGFEPSIGRLKQSKGWQAVLKKLANAASQLSV